MMAENNEATNNATPPAQSQRKMVTLDDTRYKCYVQNCYVIRKQCRDLIVHFKGHPGITWAQ